MGLSVFCELNSMKKRFSRLRVKLFRNRSVCTRTLVMGPEVPLEFNENQAKNVGKFVFLLIQLKFFPILQQTTPQEKPNF
jgi:hypothetical protein